MKLVEKVEWTIQGEDILIVNPTSDKVFCGNSSVKDVFLEFINQDFVIVETVIANLQKKYDIKNGNKEFIQDIYDILDFLKEEGILVYDI